MKPLTRKQSEILRFLHDYQKEHGIAASLEEIAAHFGGVSKTTVFDHLKLLAQKGAIKRQPLVSRSTVLTQEAKLWVRELEEQDKQGRPPDERAAVVRFLRVQKGLGDGYPAILLERIAKAIESGIHMRERCGRFLADHEATATKE